MDIHMYVEFRSVMPLRFSYKTFVVTKTSVWNVCVCGGWGCSVCVREGCFASILQCQLFYPRPSKGVDILEQKPPYTPPPPQPSKGGHAWFINNRI
jgi:hypothetical protein